MYCIRCGIPHDGVCLRGLEAHNSKESKLSEFDPFNDVPQDEDVVEPFTEAPVKKAAPKKAAPKKQPAGDREGVTVTLKGGAGFDAPWIVIHASDIEDAYEQVSGDGATLLAKLMDRVRHAAAHFTSLGGAVTNTSGGAPARPGNEAPPGTPAAPGPDWTYKTGVGKNGKTWKAWMPPRGSDAQPVWL